MQMTLYKIPISNLKLHKPIDKPSKIFAMGLNYLDHMKEVGIKKPNRQLWFSKQVNTLSGPFDTILLPKVSKQVDYEVELGVESNENFGQKITILEDHKRRSFGYLFFASPRRSGCH